MKFNSDKFTLNGVYCETKDISLLWGDDMFIEYGLSVNSPISYNGISWKNEYDEQPDTITLHMVYEIDNIPQVWTPEKIRDIESWIVTDDFIPFISDDDKEITYYFRAVNVIRRFNHLMEGWLEVEFQPISNYGYINQNIRLKKAGRFKTMKNIPSLTITNKSDLNKKYFPIIKIYNLVGELYINNLTTNQSFHVDVEGDIIIDNKIKTIYDVNGKNLLANCNREWIYLSPGDNKVQVIGDCDIEFISQYEVRI